MSRANPFGDLDDFAPSPSSPSRPVARQDIDALAEASGFPSRKARPAAPADNKAEEEGLGATPPRTQRRHVTGRNRQINIKATEETISTLYRIADELGLPLGAVLEQALAALATSLKP